MSGETVHKADNVSCLGNYLSIQVHVASYAQTQLLDTLENKSSRIIYVGPYQVTCV